MSDAMKRLQQRLAEDAPAWRDTLAHTDVHAGPEEASGGRRSSGWFSIGAPLAAAAAAAIAAALLWPAASAPPGVPAPPSPVVQLPAPAVDPLAVARVVPRVDIPAVELGLARYDAALLAPMTDEATRLRRDVELAVDFIADLVPQPTSTPSERS